MKIQRKYVAAALLVSVLAAGVCTSSIKTYAAENVANKQAENRDTHLDDNESVTGYPEYDEILRKYYQAMCCNWGATELAENGLSCLPGFRKGGLDSIGYCLVDIDYNGIAELMIGSVPEGGFGEGLYEVYTISDGESVSLVRSGEHMTYYLCEDYSIAKFAFSGDYNSWSYYELQDAELIHKETVIREEDANGINIWYRSDKDLWDENRTSLSEEAAKKIIESYVYVQLPFISLHEIEEELKKNEADTDQDVSGKKDPFYGIWCEAFWTYEEAEVSRRQWESQGYQAYVVCTADWSNLNPREIYAVTLGMYSDQYTAEQHLAEIHRKYSEAYVKYSGNYIRESAEEKETNVNYYSPFYGIWCEAFWTYEEAEASRRQWESQGYQAYVVCTADWSNLNPKEIYAVTLGMYADQNTAEQHLAEIQRRYSDAYVKYSGNYIG